jgi:hypothetical protein
MIRMAILTAVLAFCLSALAAEQSAPWFPEPPPEYRLDDDGLRQIGAKHKLNYDGLEWVNIEGPAWHAIYLPRKGVSRPALEALRHYRDQINARGGRRLRSTAGTGEDGHVNSGRMCAHFPGSPPLWLEVDVGEEQIDVSVIVEEQSDPFTLPVPPEKISGKWNPDPALPAWAPAAHRSDISALLAAFSRFFRAVPMFKMPVGFEAALSVDRPKALPFISPAGTYAYDIQLLLPRIIQPCDTCPVHRQSEIGWSVRVWVNSLNTVLMNSMDDVQGHPLYEVDGELDAGRPMTRINKGSLVMIRPGASPLWTTVTQKEYLEAQIKHQKSQFAQSDRDLADGRNKLDSDLKMLEKLDPTAAKQVRAQMEEAMKQLPPKGEENPAVAQLAEKLASLTNEQKAEPAIGPASKRIVRLNPAYVNRALRAAAPQVIVIEFDNEGFFYIRDIIERLKESDWTPVAALVR